MATELLSDDRLGGEVTAAAVTQNAFGLPAPGLDRDERRAFEQGDSFFTQPWVIAPASTEARDGLGPDFNANACAACHVRDGRAQPISGEEGPGLLLRLSLPGTDEVGGPRPHPTYGAQLTDRAVEPVAPEGTIAIDTDTIAGEYVDGTPWQLERPSYSIIDWDAGEPDSPVLISPRVAPQIVGMGLLEAIPAEDLRAAADPDDADEDGISGRVNEVWSPSAEKTMVGRFGWKANVATVFDQAAGAFAGDIGITSSANPITEDCTDANEVCRGLSDETAGGGPEITDTRLNNVVFYTSTLSVPPQRDIDDDQVQGGAEAFVAMNCTACHTPTQTTGSHPIEILADQTIRPYTDLLLHDMGERLADGRPDFLADGQEWRTPPLWGIGLIDNINGHTRFLHDGRARSLEEAVLWHGGEAQNARDTFIEADAEQREALIQFLESL